MIDPDGIRQRYAALSSILDERGRRLLVAAEAKAAGYGGIAAVWRATGVATSTPPGSPPAPLGVGYANWPRRRPLRPVGSAAQAAAASRPSRLIPT
jgi:hypothetical protein